MANWKNLPDKSHISEPVADNPLYSVVLKSKISQEVSCANVSSDLISVQMVRSLLTRNGGLVLDCRSAEVAARAAESICSEVPNAEAHLPSHNSIRPKVTVANIPNDCSPEDLSGIFGKKPSH